MKLRFLRITNLVLIIGLFQVGAEASAIGYGAATPYAVLGEAGVTNTGASVISGNVGGSTGTPAVTGFPPGVVVAPATIVTGSAQAFFDANAAYAAAQGLAGGVNLSGDTLGVGIANNLTPGVYAFNSSAGLNGTLVLDAGGSSTASWIFQIGSTLITASASGVQVINAGTGPFTGDITWAVGSAATLGTTTAFQGTILSQAASVLNTGASVTCGRVISLVAAVTLDSNTISSGNCIAAASTGGTGTGGTGGTGTGGTGTGGTGGPGDGSGGTVAVVPEPGTLMLLGIGLFAMVVRFAVKRLDLIWTPDGLTSR